MSGEKPDDRPVEVANDNTPTHAEGTPEGTTPKPKRLGQEAMRPPLPKRFYTHVILSSLPIGHAILLDGRPVKTPKKSPFAVPTLSLAEHIAAEWVAQGTHVDPETMPLTRLANTTLDAVIPNLDAVRADIVAYAGTDALCYRAQNPSDLAALQAAAWDPILAWAATELGAHFAVTATILHQAQSDAALTAIATALESYNAWQITALHVITTLTGSAILALAVARAHLTADQAWATAHCDEDWQSARWGSDDEATTRRTYRWGQMQAAATFLATLR
jgi:chaperone required for assembly of F1-ATPase